MENIYQNFNILRNYINYTEIKFDKKYYDKKKIRDRIIHVVHYLIKIELR